MIILTEAEFVNSYKLKKFAQKAIEKYKLRFPIKANENLAKIVSYLTFDGHLSMEKNVFLFTAGKKNQLKDFRKLIKDEFDIEGKIRKIPTNIWGESYECRFFSKPIVRVLKLIGAPDGNKVLREFTVPGWIKSDIKLIKSYTKIAFHCEGSMWKEGNRRKIRFRIAKSKELQKNGIKFVEDLKKMLLKLGIETTQIWTTENNEITTSLIFDIRSSSIEDFNKSIGFNKY